MKRCPYCGASNEDTATACAYCKRDLADPATPTPAAIKSSRKALYVIIGLVLVVTGLCVAVSSGGDGDGGDTSSTRRNDYGITVGTTSDEVLAIRGKPQETVNVGNDDNGLIVEWRYGDATYTMARREENDIIAYRVVGIR